MRAAPFGQGAQYRRQGVSGRSLPVPQGRAAAAGFQPVGGALQPRYRLVCWGEQVQSRQRPHGLWVLQFLRGPAHLVRLCRSALEPLSGLRRIRPQPHAGARVVQEGTCSTQGNAAVCGGFLKLKQGLQGGRQRHGSQRQAHGHVGIYFRKRVEHGEQEGFIRQHHRGPFQVGIFGQSIAHPGAGRFGQPNGARDPLNLQAFGSFA